MTLKAPFPWFGGKSRVAKEVWQRFGKIRNYIEPFFGSGAVLLGRPQGWSGVETANDADALVVNFWRALKKQSNDLAELASGEYHEAEMHARHLWLVERKQGLELSIMADPEFYDLKIAAWWVWGISMWIGYGFCSGKGPWGNVNGKLKQSENGKIERRLPHMAGQWRGVHSQSRNTLDWMKALQRRLSKVRFACGDWRRVTTKAVVTSVEPCGVFLDPPYGQDLRDSRTYLVDSVGLSEDVRNWCIERTGDPVKIALCGYEGEHEELCSLGWSEQAWKASGGYGNRNENKNATLERIWFSPSCKNAQLNLF